MFGARIKIKWEELLVDPPIHYNLFNHGEIPWWNNLVKLILKAMMGQSEFWAGLPVCSTSIKKFVNLNISGSYSGTVTMTEAKNGMY